MTGTTDHSPSGRPQGFWGKKTVQPSQRRFGGQDPSIDRVGRLELLNDVMGRESRVYRKSPPPPHGSKSINASGPTVTLQAPAVVSRSQRCFEGLDCSSSNASIDRRSRFEFLNDMSGRESRVYRKSSPPLHGRNSINASCPTVTLQDPAAASRSQRCFEGLDCSSSNTSIDHSSKFELLNDMTSRELRVYRTSPPPPVSRTSSAAHDFE